MGIDLSSVHLLSQVLPALPERADMRVLTLGVQDCHFTYTQVFDFVRRHHLPHVPVEPSRVLTTTGFTWVPAAEADRYRTCVHQKTLFELLGFSPGSISALDYSGFEGADIVHDLNKPVDPSLHGRFGLIFDGGTLEHVFSIKDALFNLSRLCKVGGLVVHFSPADLLNHGFVNVNADLYRDFYAANGFEVVRLSYIALSMTQRKAMKFYLEYAPAQLTCSLQPHYYVMLFSASRKAEAKEPTVPQQGYYRQVWNHPGANDPVRRPSVRALVPAALQRWMMDNFTLTSDLQRLVVRRRGKKVRL